MEEKGKGSSGADIASFRRGPESREMAIEEVRETALGKLFSQNDVQTRM